MSFHEANAAGLLRTAWHSLFGTKAANSAPSDLTVPKTSNAPKISLASKVWNYFFRKESENEAVTRTTLSATVAPLFQKIPWLRRPEATVSSTQIMMFFNNQRQILSNGFSSLSPAYSTHSITQFSRTYIICGYIAICFRSNSANISANISGTIYSTD